MMERIKKTGLSGKSLWLLGGVLLASNSILAYSSVPIWSKMLVFGFGILLPIIVFIWKTPPEKKEMVTERQAFPELRNLWIVAVLAGLALFLRFYRLTDFHSWPAGDEGLNAFFAVDLVRNPHWQFFYSVGQHPPLLIWSLAFFFKFFDSPFLDLWFLPAVFSALVVLTGFSVSRLFFSSSFSWIFTCLLAFSFWPLFFGRFCIQGVFIPFWELACFLLLVYAIQSTDPRRRDKWLLILGLWAGLGSLTFTSWLVVMAALTVTVFILFFKKSPRSFFLYLAALGAAFLPFALSAASAGFGNHMIESTISSHLYTIGRQTVTSASYLTSLFWGSCQAGSSYGPSWGGMLNPVLSACFQIGLLELILHRRNGFARWTLFFLGMDLLPGLLTADYVEFYRVIQVMPLLLLVTAVGVQKMFLSFRPGRGRSAVALLLGLCSFSLDINHLRIIEVADSGINGSVLDDNLKAYRVLDSARSQLGPGLIFTDFLLLSHNHTLSVDTYWFNAALNPKLDPTQARWAGVVTNIHYQHYLMRRFPKAQWFWVDQDVPEEDGGMTVGVIPINADNQAVFQKWLEAHEIFHGLNIQYETIQNQADLYRQAEMNLSRNSPFMSQDPFLESLYDEWTAQYHWGTSYDSNIAAIQRAIQKGYPTAHLYCKLGYFYWAEGRGKDARAACAMALKQKPNYTVAASAMRYMYIYSKKTAPY